MPNPGGIWQGDLRTGFADYFQGRGARLAEIYRAIILSGEPIERARREIRQVLQDYRPVKDRMTHRFVHEDASGYTWTNDRDGTKVVWLLKPARLPRWTPGRSRPRVRDQTAHSMNPGEPSHEPNLGRGGPAEAGTTSGEAPLAEAGAGSA